jgi:hypothetical protein
MTCQIFQVRYLKQLSQVQYVTNYKLIKVLI